MRIWRFRRTSVTLAVDYAATVWTWAGARPELRVTHSAIQLLAEDGAVVGVFRIAWRTPRPNLATIWKVEWDPEYVGESLMWDLLEELIGITIDQRAA
jgi:hypothetical protein